MQEFEEEKVKSILSFHTPPLPPPPPPSLFRGEQSNELK